MTTGDDRGATKTGDGWSATVKGLLGAGLLAVAGFFGTLAVNVLSAPKDSVAYDLIQSLTGALKTREPAKPPVAPPPAVAATEAPMPPKTERSPDAPETAGRRAAAASTQLSRPAPEPAPAPPIQSVPPTAQPPTPSVRASGPVEEPEAAETDVAPERGLADRVRKTAELARRVAASTAALNAARVLSVNDRAAAAICGANYRVEVTSTAAGQGAVALLGPDAGAQPIRLSVGEPRELAAGCQVELLLAMEDLDDRRAQLRETKLR